MTKTPITQLDQYQQLKTDVKTRVRAYLNDRNASPSQLMSSAMQAQYAARRNKLLSKLPKNSIVIIASGNEKLRNGDAHYAYRVDSDFNYLTGFNEPESYLVLSNVDGQKNNTFTLFVPPKDSAREIWDGKRLGVENATLMGADKAFSNSEFSLKLPNLLQGHEHVFTKLGDDVEFDETILEKFNKLRSKHVQGLVYPAHLSQLTPILSELRLIKDELEIALMQLSADISVIAHLDAMQAAPKIDYEFELQAAVEQNFTANNAMPAYTSIVGGGNNACVLHYIKNDAAINHKDLILIDAGSEFANYAADITRTFPKSGIFNAPQKALYNLVLKAQLAAIDEVKAGKLSKDYHTKAVRIITQGLIDLGILNGDLEDNMLNETYKAFFMHGTGHWLGMDVHDVGAYKLPNHEEFRPLEKGMVVTVEPGLYIAQDNEQVEPQWRGIGIRIEDDVLVTENEPIILTGQLPKTVEDIELWMKNSG